MLGIVGVVIRVLVVGIARLVLASAIWAPAARLFILDVRGGVVPHRLRMVKRRW